MKRITAIILALLMLTALCGCGKNKTVSVENELTVQVDEFMGHVKAFDLESIDGTVDHSFIELINKIISLDEKMNDDAVEGYLKTCASKISYEITSVDTEKLTVTADVTYIDATEILTAFFKTIVSSVSSSVFGGDGMPSGEELYSSIKEAVNSFDADTYDTISLTFSFENEDAPELTDVSDSIKDVLTANTVSTFDKILGKFISLPDLVEKILSRF